MLLSRGPIKHDSKRQIWVLRKFVGSLFLTTGDTILEGIMTISGVRKIIILARRRRGFPLTHIGCAAVNVAPVFENFDKFWKGFSTLIWPYKNRYRKASSISSYIGGYLFSGTLEAWRTHVQKLCVKWTVLDQCWKYLCKSRPPPPSFSLKGGTQTFLRLRRAMQLHHPAKCAYRPVEGVFEFLSLCSIDWWSLRTIHAKIKKLWTFLMTSFWNKHYIKNPKNKFSWWTVWSSG